MPVGHRLESWKPNSFCHPHADKVGFVVPMEDLRRVDFMAWSSQASLSVFLKECMKESVEMLKETE